MDISRIDLRLLVAFEAVMAERHVTRAANKIGMTQSAVSNALNRLRHLVNDPLFIRGVSGMRPTPRALELSGPVSAALRQLQLAMDPPVFDPASAKRTFKLSMSAHSAEIILPSLVRQISRQAPGINIQVVPKSNVNIVELLDTGQIDVAVGVTATLPQRFAVTTLFEDRYVAVMHTDHPLAATDPLDFKAFLAARHVLLNPTGQQVVHIDRQLARLKFVRNIVLTVNQLVVAASVIARSDMVTATFHRSIADLNKLFDLGLVTRDLPLDPVQVQLVWLPSLSQHPAHDWFRQLLMVHAAHDDPGGRDAL
jgi:DNA-binding transcriptional LysR family regulator